MQRMFVLRTEEHAQSLWAFLKQNWRSMADTQQPLAVTVTQHKEKRTRDQNKRYWAILNEIADQAWVNGKQYSADAWHEHFKQQLIGAEELPNGGKVGISSASLNVEEFGIYMTKIEVYATSQLGCDFIL
jgi:hypothetical protein